MEIGTSFNVKNIWDLAAVSEVDSNKKYSQVATETTPSGDTVDISDEARALYSQMIHKYDESGSQTNSESGGGESGAQGGGSGSGGASSSSSSDSIENQIQSLKSQLAALASQVGASGGDAGVMGKMNALEAQIAALEAQLKQMA